MAVYRLGDMVRMRRKALGITQEELVEIYHGTETEEEGKSKKILESVSGKSSKAGSSVQDNVICSAETLRRIEKGRTERVDVDIFKKIMTKLGVLPERYYASIMLKDTRGFGLKSEIHIHICRGEYEQAEKKLKELEVMMVPDYPRNEQYRMWAEATLSYRREELSAEEYLEVLLNALCLTVPMLDEIDISGWPFNENEFNILSEIGNVYSDMNERDKECEFLLKLKKNVEKEYMDCAHYVVWHMRALTGLSQLMCLENKYKESLEYCKIGIEECREWWILGNVYDFLYDIAWNTEHQIRKGIFDNEKSTEKWDLLIEKEREFCKKHLVQAYYLSVAQGNLHHSDRIRRLYEHYYPEEIKLP